MGPVRLGFIGCGNVLGAYRSVVEKLQRAGLATVTRACGRTGQRESAVQSFPSATFSENENEILSADDIDVVVILTSMKEHARLAQAALEHGKHVLVEKPFATTLDEGRTLVCLAQSRGLHLVCAPFTTLSPTFAAISRRIRSGSIGKVCSARARYGWSGPWWNEWFYKPGGGCLFDLGIYSVTTLSGLIGPVKRVMAMTGIAIPERDIQGRSVRVEAEDNAHVLLDFGDGASAVLTTGFTIQQYRSPAVEIYGTTGVIQMLGDDWDPDGYELWENAAGCWKVFKETDPEWPWTDGLRHLVESLHRGVPLQTSSDHALHVLEVLLAAQVSGKEGRAIPIESTFAPPTFPGAESADLPSDTPEAAHRVHDRTREYH